MTPLTAERQAEKMALGMAAAQLESAELSAHDQWLAMARPEQLAPDWEWFIWFLMTGRGWGKTLTAAQWIREQIEARWDERLRIAFFAPTFADIRDTMVEGETGILSILPKWTLRGGSIDSAWNRSIGELHLANGGKIRGFSSEKPGRARGPQHHLAWGEEVGELLDAEDGIAHNQQGATIDNILFGLRLGARPQMVLTGTPKPKKLIKELLYKKGPDGEANKELGPRPEIAYTFRPTEDNIGNLSETYKTVVIAPYEGTRLGRQELGGELLEDIEGALWTQDTINADRVTIEQVPEDIVAVRLGVDPPGGQTDCGGVIVAKGKNGELYVIADTTAENKPSPGEWSKRMVRAYFDHDVDTMLGEKNYGGEMVEHTIRTVPAERGYPAGTEVKYRNVNATRGKQVRAEPCVGLYEQHRVHHVGHFPKLEDEMTTWVPGESKRSPNRLDALVWCIYDLAIAGRKRATTGKMSDNRRSRGGV